MLDAWLRSLSKNVIAYGSLTIALLLIWLLNPPHTICDTQLQIFKEDQAGNLFARREKGIQFKPKIVKQIDRCKASNSAGGCYEFFESLKDFQSDLNKIPIECASQVQGVSEIKAALHEGLRLMTMIAWGSEPPKGLMDKNAWLSRADLVLFCALKKSALNFLGDEYLSQLQESMFKELPGASTMSRNDVWQRMLLSTRCEAI